MKKAKISKAIKVKKISKSSKTKTVKLKKEKIVTVVKPTEEPPKKVKSTPKMYFTKDTICF